MTAIGYRRIIIVSGIAIAGLLVLAWELAKRYAIQQADARDAWSAIVDYGRSRDSALRSDPREAVQMLEVIATLPPRRTNSLSPVLRMVERERERDVRDVLEYLRRTTGEDLGDDPAKWIEKYSRHEDR